MSAESQTTSSISGTLCHRQHISLCDLFEVTQMDLHNCNMQALDPL